MNQHEERKGGALRACFQVITDTHVREDDNHLYNRHFDQALKDILASGYAGQSSGIMHAGDITDHGLAEEYEALDRIIAANREGLPPLRYCVGNHDVALGRWDYRIGHYEQHTGMRGTYHDHWVDGYHYIFLGTEAGLDRFASLSEPQLAWLDAKLSEVAEDAAPGQPAFVFLHQPLKNTTAGSLEAQAWFGVEQDEALRAVLLRHPQAILFTGHTHWHLESERTMHQLGEHGQGPHLFNAGSVAYLWTDADDQPSPAASDEPASEMAHEPGKPASEMAQLAAVAQQWDDAYVLGSQGYYVEIYDDAVLVRGRDFTRGTWIETAQFRIALPVGVEVKTETQKVEEQIG
ncbi:metallophosphoesterase family protein [Paenibacillus sp. 1P07SE]|uniref:metallophosphoesterase family protein n=1 Tax=Paenibacillus sp. 1P07SE TaxID=3132209 RepID=UPI0039A5BAE3